MVGSLLYSLVRFWLDVIATSQGDQAKLQAEVLALRRQVQVLERQIKRVRWSRGDRMILAALRERIPPSAWAGLLVRPETVLGWHRELVSRKWAAYRGRPRRGRPPASEECRELIVRMARENPRWGYFPYSRRTAQAWPHGGGDHDSISAARRWHPAGRSSFSADLEAVPGRARREPGGGGLLQRVATRCRTCSCRTLSLVGGDLREST